MKSKHVAMAFVGVILLGIAVTYQDVGTFLPVEVSDRLVVVNTRTGEIFSDERDGLVPTPPSPPGLDHSKFSFPLQ